METQSSRLEKLLLFNLALSLIALSVPAKRLLRHSDSGSS
jgi:hypothetical protein